MKRATRPATALSVLLVIVALAACGSDDDSSSSGAAGSSGSSGNPAGVGNRCAKNEDCATKNCYLGMGGGYCTTTCADEGSTSQCPTDTVCKPIQGGARRCLLVCGSASTCPEGACAKEFCPNGSTCTSVSMTTAKACEPNG